MKFKELLFSLFFCIYIFWIPLSCAVLGQQGLTLDGSIMRAMLIIIIILSFIFYRWFGNIQTDIKVWTVLVVFGLSFYSTGFLYNYSSEGYQGQLLRWGSDCISATLIGMTLMKQKDYTYIHKIMPIVCIILTPFFVKGTLVNAVDQGQMHLDSGMSYQSVAYNLAVLFCLSMYYAFVNKDSITNVVRIIMIVCLPIQSVTCCMSGGRGGVVLLFVYLFIMICMMLMFKRTTKKKITIISIVGVFLFFYVADSFGLWESAGFQRSSGLMDEDDRFVFWKQMFVYIEDNNYFGYGLGGDYFTFGFYTHNIFIDFLLETGIIGTIFLLIYFYKIYKNILAHIWSNDIFVLILIICLYGLVMNLFSGYWITTYSHWFALGVSTICNRYYVIDQGFPENTNMNYTTIR